jgi:hypothetical protein
LRLLVDLDEILCGGDTIVGDLDTIVGDLDVVTSNPIASNLLKLLRLKFVRWKHYLHNSALLNNRLGLFSIFGFLWLLHIQCLADVNHGNQGMYLTLRQKDIDAVM